jgi:hypothetical protein
MLLSTTVPEEKRQARKDGCSKVASQWTGRELDWPRWIYTSIVLPGRYTKDAEFSV